MSLDNESSRSSMSLLHATLRLLRPARVAAHPRDGRALGARGERAAAKMLRRAGYRIAGRNVKVAAGEADIVCIAPDKRTVVVVEVKTRVLDEDGGRAGPPPEANIHEHKRRKLVAVTRCLAQRRSWAGRPVRIDVVAVDWPRSAPGNRRARPVLRHYIGVVG